MTTAPPAPSSHMPHAQYTRIRQAGHWARILWPNIIGENLDKELTQWADWGHRIGGHHHIHQIIDAIHDERRKRNGGT